MTNSKHSSSKSNPLLKGLLMTTGADLFDKITSSKILLVGAGGIGCELLKNLALSGFTHVEVIDLDTIDVSNLNRQFLFRSQHVGMPKCTVACAAALAMLLPPSLTNDNSNDKSNQAKYSYTAHHGNVCDNSRFNVNFVKGFDLVLNALDNVAARRRVNRLCLAAAVPLVEAGTTGYLGQVTVIDKQSNTECYECQAKPTQKVYPICTIRSTPSMPVHTIVWAKELYKLLFGPKVEESMLFEDQTGDEKSTYMDLVMDLRSKITAAVSVGNDDDNNNNDEKESKESKDKNEDLDDTISSLAASALVALYNTEIEKQLAMDRFKTAQKVPTAICKNMIQNVILDKKYTNKNIPSKQTGYKQTTIPSKEECIIEVISTIMDAATLLKSGETLLPEFDKDDTLAMKFVTFASNLRSYVFGIDPIQSYYSAKGIAGNIIPAIATTNAIVAGMQVLAAFHILKKQLEKKDGELKQVCKYTYCLRDKTRKGYYLQPTILPDPNPKCFVCKNAMINLSLDTSKWTLDMLLSRIIKKELGFMEPSLMLGSSIIYEEGDDIDEDEYFMNKSKKLTDLPAGGVQSGTVVRIEDFTQDLEVDLCVNHKSEWEMKDGEEQEEEEKFSIGGDKPVVASSDAITSKDASTGNAGKDDDDNDDIVEVLAEDHSANSKNTNGNKRSAIDIVDDNDSSAPKKKARSE